MRFAAAREHLLAELQLMEVAVPPLDTLGEVLNRTHTRRVIRIPGTAFRPTLYIKWFWRRSLQTRLGNLVRQGAPRSAFEQEYEMLLCTAAAGIEVPKPVLVRPHNGGELIVLEELSGTSLHHFGTGHEPLPSRREQLVAAGAIGRAIARLHDAGFRFDDLKADHVRLRRDPAADDGVRVGFLDFATASLHRRISRNGRVASLATLCATLGRARIGGTVRLAAVRAYLAALEHPIADPDAFIREIGQRVCDLWTRRRLRINASTFPAEPPRWTEIEGGRGQRDSERCPDAVIEAMRTMIGPLADGFTSPIAFPPTRVHVHGAAFMISPGSPEAGVALRRLSDHLRAFGVAAPRIVAWLGHPGQCVLAFAEPRPGSFVAVRELPDFLRQLAVAGVTLTSSAADILRRGKDGIWSIDEIGGVTLPETSALPTPRD